LRSSRPIKALWLNGTIDCNVTSRLIGEGEHRCRWSGIRSLAKLIERAKILAVPLFFPPSICPTVLSEQVPAAREFRALRRDHRPDRRAAKANSQDAAIDRGVDVGAAAEDALLAWPLPSMIVPVVMPKTFSPEAKK
jgi:hypothetical protein